MCLLWLQIVKIEVVEQYAQNSREIRIRTFLTPVSRNMPIMDVTALGKLASGSDLPISIPLGQWRRTVLSLYSALDASE